MNKTDEAMKKVAAHLGIGFHHGIPPGLEDRTGRLFCEPVILYPTFLDLIAKAKDPVTIGLFPRILRKTHRAYHDLVENLGRAPSDGLGGYCDDDEPRWVTPFYLGPRGCLFSLVCVLAHSISGKEETARWQDGLESITQAFLQ